MNKTSSSILAVFSLFLFLTIISGYGLPLYPLNYPVEVGNKYSIGKDYFHNFVTVQLLNQGMQDVYNDAKVLEISAAMSKGAWSMIDNHPLPSYLFYIPLAKMDFAQGYYLMNYLQLIFFNAAVILLSFYLFKKYYAMAFAFITVGASFYLTPMFSNIWMGNVGMALAAFLIFTYLCLEKKWDIAAGIALSGAVVLKIYPALLLVPLCFGMGLGLEKRWKAVLACIISLLIMFLAAGFLWGFGHYANYLVYAKDNSLTGYSTSLQNYTVTAWLTGLLGNSHLALRKVVHVLILLGFSVGLFFFTKRWYTESKEYNLLAFSLWITFAMIMAPVAWDYHHCLFIMVLAAFANLCLEKPKLFNLAYLGIVTLAFLFSIEGFSYVSNVLCRILGLFDPYLAEFIPSMLFTLHVPLLLTVCVMLISFLIMKKINLADDSKAES